MFYKYYTRIWYYLPYLLYGSLHAKFAMLISICLRTMVCVFRLLPSYTIWCRQTFEIFKLCLEKKVWKKWCIRIGSSYISYILSPQKAEVCASFKLAGVHSYFWRGCPNDVQFLKCHLNKSEEVDQYSLYSNLAEKYNHILNVKSITYKVIVRQMDITQGSQNWNIQGIHKIILPHGIILFFE